MVLRSTRALVVAVLCALALHAGPASAGQGGGPPDRPAGLMWNRTGLPAVFPLVIKTVPGRDYFMVLTDDATGSPALAAYVKGGEFFRVLVPPGTFRVRFFHGTGWQGQEGLFGPGSQTRVFDLPEALTFRTRGISRKSGHIVDLRGVIGGEGTIAAVEGISICQAILTEPKPDGIYLDLHGAVPGKEPTDTPLTVPGHRRPTLRYDPYAVPDSIMRNYVCE